MKPDQFEIPIVYILMIEHECEWQEEIIDTNPTKSITATFSIHPSFSDHHSFVYKYIIGDIQARPIELV